MNYGQMRDFILQLINRYSIAGSKYQPSYNNQQDYILRIPALINDGLIYIASGIRRMPAQTVINPREGEPYGSYYRRFLLPEDCLEVCSGGLFRPGAKYGESKYMRDYKIQEPDHILIPMNVREDLVLEYYRRPQFLPREPAEEQRIDAMMDVQMAVCYYAAAHLVMLDDAFLYTTLYNEFENKAARLTQSPTTEISTVVDVYGYGEMGDGYG